MNLNKIIFEQKIQKIKNEDTRNYFLSFFSLKTILIKLLSLLVVGIVVLSTSFGLRQIFIDYFPNNIIPNTGISFSFLSNASNEVIYLVQSIPCVLTFLFFVFINKPSIYIGLLIIFFGGLSNIMDRSLFLNIVINGKPFPPNAVVDYIPWFNTKCNLPDIYISIGTGLVIIFLIVYIVKVFKEENKNDKNKQ